MNLLIFSLSIGWPSKRQNIIPQSGGCCKQRLIKIIFFQLICDFIRFTHTQEHQKANVKTLLFGAQNGSSIVISSRVLRDELSNFLNYHRVVLSFGHIYQLVYAGLKLVVVYGNIVPYNNLGMPGRLHILASY